MAKYDIYKYFSKVVLEAGEQIQAAQQQQQPSSPAQPQPQPPQSQTNPSDAFRSLQGQTIAGMQFSPNGNNGGTIKIKVKNSYIPFTISWVNQQVTITTMAGETIVLGGSEQ